jgi:hypothetical protein
MRLFDRVGDHILGVFGTTQSLCKPWPELTMGQGAEPNFHADDSARVARCERCTTAVGVAA